MTESPMLQSANAKHVHARARAPAEHDRNVTCPSSEPIDVKGERVEKFIHGVSLVLRHHRAPKSVVRSIQDQIREYVSVPDEGTFLKRAKYVVLWPMAYFLDNELPDEADQPFHFRGRAWRWMRQRFACKNNKNVHLWYSFLQSKRAAAPVTPEIVLSNFQKHRQQMLMPDPMLGEDDLSDEALDNLEVVVKRLAKQLAVELKSFWKTPWRVSHKASESASFESTRKSGGQAGLLRSLLGQSNKLRQQEGLGGISETRSFARKGDKVLYRPLVKTLVRQGELDDLEDILSDYVLKSDIPKDKSGNYIPVVLKAKVEAVLEPFKVRTISKDPALPSYIAKEVQVKLHGLMRSMKPFRLIGRPFDPTDLMDLYAVQSRLNGGNFREEYWLSIDYSAATDGLSASLSQKILRDLLEEGAYDIDAINEGDSLDKRIRLLNILLGVLAPHEISYPKVGGVQLPDVMQQNGQLMGSILSFPILCLANLALYLTVRRRLRPEAKISDLLNSVLINGDDMLYIGTLEEWKLHQELGAKFGLAMSPGKAYFHKSYANINSLSVVMDLRNHNPTPFVIPFLNVGLMTGNHKVLAKVGGEEVDRAPETPLISVLNKVVDGAWKGRQADVFRQYISMHSREIRREARGRNLFLPISLGGLGCNLISGLSTSVTAKQAYQVEEIIRSQPWLWPMERPLPDGVEVEDVIDFKIDPIRFALDSERKVSVMRKKLFGPLRTDKLFFPWGIYRRY